MVTVWSILATLARMILALLLLIGLLGVLQLLLPIRIAFRFWWQDGGPWHWQLRVFSILVARQLRGPPVRPQPRRRGWVVAVRQRAVRVGERWIEPYVRQSLSHPRLALQSANVVVHQLSRAIRRFVAELEAGTGDPATTALLYGLSCSIIPALWPAPPPPAAGTGVTARAKAARGDTRRSPGQGRSARRVRVVARLSDTRPSLQVTCILTVRPGQIIFALARGVWQIRHMAAGLATSTDASTDTSVPRPPPAWTTSYRRGA